jgi:dihydrofolate reductase
MIRYVLVAAVAANGVIGTDGEIPWHLPEDLRHFKETTAGHPVVMGRETYESIAARIGGPLPHRLSVVLTTRDPDLPEGAVRAGSIPEARETAAAAAADMGVETVYVVGGSTVYEQFLPFADAMVLTELDDAYEGDVEFPEWNRERWRETAREERDGFAFVTYERT